MRKYLLPEEGNFYKANLHCHSTLSDGRLTPEEIKEIYKAEGYSIVAFTDHDKFYTHNDLTDDTFLAINGYEPGVVENMPEDRSYHFRKVFHMCCLAIDKDKTGGIDLDGRAKFYTPEFISEYMQLGREQGFFVTYNHPVWSLEKYEDYINYNNMDAFEIYNWGCIVDGFFEYNEQIYDEMLHSGKRIFCLATDDNHNVGGGTQDSFGGYVMIKAQSLEYSAVMDAIIKGNFYSSQGPVIKSIYIEDDEIVAECEGAREIRFNTDTRAHSYRIANRGELVTECRMKLDARDKYVRVTVTDREGGHANSNAYFLDEIM